MDIVHHALMGGAGFVWGLEAGYPAAGAAFLAASVLPDADALLMAGGRRFYLRHHQGITHSVVLAPLYAALIAAPLAHLTGEPGTFLAALLGLWLHSALDLANTFRIALFAPFSDERFSLDALFFIDAGAYLLTGAGAAALSWGAPAGLAVPAYFLALAAYVAGRALQHRRVLARLGDVIAIPTALSPFRYFVLDGLATYEHDALTGAVHDRRERTGPAPAAVTLARRSPVFADLERVLRALTVTEVREDRAGTRLEAFDLAVRNFGGSFGRVVLEFDTAGTLIHEEANL